MFQSTLVFTEADAAASLAAMRAAVPGDGTTVAPARYGVRWDDTLDAVRWGSNVAEMAVATTTRESDDCWVFQILTVADEPVTLRVRHVAPPKVIELSAVAGLFGDRQDLVDRLFDRVNAAFRMYGAKARPVIYDEPAP